MRIINYSLILVNYSKFDILKWFGQPRAVQKCIKNMIILKSRYQQINYVGVMNGSRLHADVGLVTPFLLVFASVC